MLLGDTIIIDNLDAANHYRKEVRSSSPGGVSERVLHSRAFSALQPSERCCGQCCASCQRAPAAGGLWTAGDASLLALAKSPPAARACVLRAEQFGSAASVSAGSAVLPALVSLVSSVPRQTGWRVGAELADRRVAHGWKLWRDTLSRRELWGKSGHWGRSCQPQVCGT